MQIVIDIPEKMYEDCKVRNTLHYSLYDFSSMIVNGTPLPKGHGRLIDENDLDGEYVCSLGSGFECVSYCSCSECVSGEWQWNSDVSDAPTIIEADKGE